MSVEIEQVLALHYHFEQLAMIRMSDNELGKSGFMCNRMCEVGNELARLKYQLDPQQREQLECMIAESDWLRKRV